METSTHVFFYGHTPNKLGIHIFSQFYPCSFSTDDRSYCCAEQWMMSQKALVFKDTTTFDKIMSAKNPTKIKSLGRQIKNFDEEKWNKVKFDIVYKGNLMKFSQNDDLLKRLLNTKNKILVEASPYDKIWGIGLTASDAIKTDPDDWPGANLLGKALMKVRDALDE